MRILSAIGRAIAYVFAGLSDFFGTVLGGIFGDVHWQAPAWLASVYRSVRAVLSRLLAAIINLPASVLRGALAVVLLLIAAGLGWHAYQNRPQALADRVAAKIVEAVYHVNAPSANCYNCKELKDRGPRPMNVTFDESVAPLAVNEQPLPANQVQLRPAMAGSWRWSNERTLSFQPTQEWPLDTDFEVHFDKIAIRPGVQLPADVPKFHSPVFRAGVQSASFLQDPQDPLHKFAQVALQFSHPVDIESLKRRLTLKYSEQNDDGSRVDRPVPPYELKFDDAHVSATLITATMALPVNDSRLDLAVDAGVVTPLGGNAAPAMATSVTVPGRGGLKVSELQLGIARDADDAPVQTLTLNLSQSTTEAEVRGHVKAWQLPLKNPDAKLQKAFEDEAKGNANKPYPWNEATAVAVQNKAESLELRYDALEADHADLHSFRYTAEPGRFLLIRVPAGMKAYGGYELTGDYVTVQQVPEFQPELRLTSQGALLAMSGQKTLTIFTRDLPGVRVEIGRLLPQQIQHFVTQSSGRLQQFNWRNENFGEDNFTERFTKDIALPKLKHGEAHYEALDLAPYLAQGLESKRGVFFLKLTGYDAEKKQAVDSSTRADTGDSENGGDESSEGDGEGGGYNYGARTSDSRLIVVTDLGLVLKTNKDGTQEVFVQSIASGEPVAGVTLDVIAKNGSAVVTRVTDADGHARLPELRGFEREKQPVLLLAKKAGDQSFLPLDGRSPALDTSRFDVGGVSQSVDAGALSAYLFTDRGLYRPGETAHIGIIVKAAEFAHTLPQTPVSYEISDPRGAIVYKTVRTLPASGFDELVFTGQPSAPSGNYTVTAWLPGPDDEDPKKQEANRKRLGSLDFKVREFEPDRLKIHLDLDQQRATGWLKPEQVKSAHVDLQNLFGTPAQDRRVTAELKLTPWVPSFPGYGDYQFNDPRAARSSETLTLDDGKTGEDGQANLPIDLSPYAASSYYLHLTTQGFEPDGGRGVTAEAGQVVSSLPYLVGWKAKTPLYWIAKDSKPAVELIAIDPQTHRTATDDLKLKRYERQWISVLTRSDSGAYRYESRLKETLLSDDKLALPAEGSTQVLATSKPGSFYYTVSDAAGRIYARIDYEVAGNGQVTRNLEKNAELKLSLSKKDYAPGEEVEVSLVAPYAGAGLITIEREKVLAWKWFKAGTTASVQKIKLPEGLEGSAYVHVMFTRDPGSADTFSSPLSYGIAPLTVAIDARRAALKLDAPAKIKPGETLTMKLTAATPGKAVVYAVDEGILQVARYKTPDPLGFYFQKRSLDVRTLQILDLILPEFRGLAAVAAPGGDADSALGAKLNPFKRKTDAPIAWWSGIVDVGPEAKTLEWVVPDRFSGALRLVAVSVAPETIGVVEGKTLVKGDFTLLPNAPLVVTPGDEFDVSTGISNNLEDAPKNAPIVVTLEPTPNLEVLGPLQQTIPISANREGLARYRVRAKDALGNAELKYTVSYGGKTATIRSTLSVRPPVPYSPNLASLLVEPGKTVEFPLTHAADFYPQFRKVEASVSTLPLVMAHGLTAYLGSYPYQCTEQLMSMAMPALVLSSRPEFGNVNRERGTNGFAGVFGELALRQRPEGDFSLWSHGGYAVEPVSIYAQQFLIEAHERGLSVPPGLIESGNRFLTMVARRKGQSFEDDRDSAFAIYLLTRQGQVMSSEADAVLKRLDKRDKGWRQDSAALWLAAAYARMQQKTVADTLVNALVISDKGNGYAYDHGFYYYNRMSSDAELLYVLAKNFPEQLVKYGPVLAHNLSDSLNGGYYTSYASGTTLLALDAYTTVAEQQAGKVTVDVIAADGHATPLALPADAKMPSATVPDSGVKLRVTNSGTLPAYGVVAELGFGRKTPETAESHGIEVIRTLTDAAGKKADQVTVGDTLTVELRVRAVTRDAVTDVALVDLLPGGFEIVQTTPEAAEQTMEQARTGPETTPEDGADNAADQSAEGNGNGEGEGEAGADASSPTASCNCAWVEQSDVLKFAEPREDRAVFYLDASRTIQTFRYRIKAISVGRFRLPPAFGEAMYDRKVFAHSTGGSIEVIAPKEAGKPKAK